jgi:hypothetical protein
MDRRFLHEQLYNKDIARAKSSRIVICGCGALGANLAVSLARRGFSRFCLIDYDRIEEHNISTQPWTEFQIGQRKAEELAQHLFTIGDVQSSVYSSRITELPILEKLTSGSSVVVDTFDNHTARELTSKISSVPVLHAGMSRENTGEVTWNERYTVPHDIVEPGGDPCNYPLARTLIELTVVATSEAIMRYIMTGERSDYRIHGNTLAITKISD